MNTLEEYLLEKIPDSQLFASTDTQKYIQLLKTSQIQRLTDYALPKDIQNKEYSYRQLIDQVKHHLVHQNSKNVLIYGYNQDERSAQDHFQYANFQMDYLQGKEWQQLYRRIGAAEILDIIINCVCFVRLDHMNNFLQVLGEHRKPHIRITKEVVSKNNMLYANPKSVKGPITANVDSLFKDVFHGETSLQSKKYRPIKRILADMIKRHENCRYMAILNNICPLKYGSSPSPQTNIEYCTPVKSVLQFVLQVMTIVIPLEIFGSTHNRGIIVKKMVEHINSGKGYKIRVSKLLDNIKIKDVLWCSNSIAGAKINKQEFEKRKKMVLSFLRWLFYRFIPLLVGGNFYVTESPVASGILYYRHSDWRRISKPFLDSYFNKYLDNDRDLASSGDEELIRHVKAPQRNSKHSFLRGRLRLLPKINDFRVICVPLITKQHRFHFLHRANHEIKPIRDIFQRLREKQVHSHARCKSIIDVYKQIRRYKRCIATENGGKVPHLYFVKFDARQCYDTIPRQLAEKLATELLGPEKIEWYHKTVNWMNVNNINSIGSISNGNYLSNSFVIAKSNQPNDLNLVDQGVIGVSNQNSSGKIYIDKSKYSGISSERILSVIQEELYNSRLVIAGKEYFRQEGVFQGFPLSSLFCDIVYDDLIETKFDFVDQKDSLLLRLADDFLIITPIKEIAERAFGHLQNGFQEYNTSVNQTKTVSNLTDDVESVVNYCGITINMSTLEISKQYDTVLSKTVTSYKMIYSFLYWMYETRLIDQLIDFKVNMSDTVLKNISSLCQHISCIFVKNVKKLGKSGFSENRLKDFVERIVLYTIGRLQAINGSIGRLSSQQKAIAANVCLISINAKLQTVQHVLGRIVYDWEGV